MDILILLLLLLLVFIPPSCGCHTGMLSECQRAPFVPGHNLVGEGFDIVKLQTTGAFVVDVKTFLVGPGHDAKCTLCHNALLNQTQKMPVSVSDWRIKVQCRRSLSSKMFESSSSVVKEGTSSISTSWKVGLSIPKAGLSVGGTHSKESAFAQSHSTKDKYSFISHEFKCEYYNFRLHSQPPLSKEFEETLKNLPTTLSHKNNDAYDHFISMFGTHFIRTVKLGGRVHSTTAIRTCEMAMNGLSMHTVSDCLSVEASATIKGVTISPSVSFCKGQSKKLKTGQSFSAAFSDRITEVLGGNHEVEDLLFNPGNKSGYKKWLTSLTRLPGLVSYELSSLHMLVRNNPVLKSNVRRAISDYITRNAIRHSCTSSCSVGRRNSNCVCKCSGHKNVDSNCCPGQPGIATMTVTVIRGTGLWGDYFSKTDGYVKVLYGKQGDTTPVIWNNDFPYWNFTVRFGTVNLQSRKHLIFEVWDRDHKWNDNKLGGASLLPTRGLNVKKRFKLNHGSLYVSVSVECGPSLKGSLCGQYSPSPNSEARLDYVEALKGDSEPRTLLQSFPSANKYPTL